MDVKEIRNVGFFKKKVEIGEYFYNEDGTPRPKEDAYVVLREPTTVEFNKISSGDKEQNFKAIMELLPKCIIEHNLESNGQPISTEEVSKIILQSASCFVFVAEEWQKSLPLVKRNAARLKELSDQSSQAT